jgi:hypothetical protein
LLVWLKELIAYFISKEMLPWLQTHKRNLVFSPLAHTQFLGLAKVTDNGELPSYSLKEGRVCCCLSKFYSFSVATHLQNDKGIFK